VLIRALACNVPVVTTDSFLAARDLLGAAQSCAIVPTGEPQPLAQAIDRCLASEANEDLRRLVEPYAVEASIAAHIATLAQAVKERTAAKVLS
jgi:glycosyltransferase involved in cell wall biosynthesis